MKSEDRLNDRLKHFFEIPQTDRNVGVENQGGSTSFRRIPSNSILWLDAQNASFGAENSTSLNGMRWNERGPFMFYSGRGGLKLLLYTGIGSNCFIMQIATVPRDRCFSTARGTEGACNKSSAGSCTSLLLPDSGEPKVEDREESRGTRSDFCSLRFSSQQSWCSDVVTNVHRPCATSTCQIQIVI